MDCSGFTQQVYQKLGVSLPRSAFRQSYYGVKIGVNELKVGDLLFYRTYKSAPSHVAIYAGNGQMIHASYIAKRIQFDSINKSYYRERFLFAKRLSLDKK
jgi:cell wall-associated NlpC family hydrolase